VSEKVVIKKHFAMVWGSLVLLATFFAILYALDANVVFSGALTTVIGFMGGLIAGKEGN
jgi:VIT1/CCC1 family predicted Fe2+/Mn2+ transporter